MFKFSDKARSTLYKNGWTESRSVEIDVYKNYYLETKQPISDAILKFLKSFAGLELGIPTNIIVDPVEGTEDLGIVQLNDYAENWICKPVTVIGHIGHHDIYLMAVTGEIYSVFDAWVFKTGNTLVESIENILATKTIERITKQES